MLSMTAKYGLRALASLAKEEKTTLEDMARRGEMSRT